jgi:hypothetical protein
LHRGACRVVRIARKTPENMAQTPTDERAVIESGRSAPNNIVLTSTRQ